MIMLDIETLSTKSNAVILTIGAIKIGKDIINTGILPPIESLNTFYRRINIQSCIDIGLETDPETIDWWKKQKAEAIYEAIENKDRIPIKEALQQFITWFGTDSNEEVWAQGIDFDCVILRNAFEKCGLVTPWKFWNCRDCRTMLNKTGIYLKTVEMEVCNRNANFVKHNALSDCYIQLIALLESFRYVSYKDNNKRIRRE